MMWTNSLRATRCMRLIFTCLVSIIRDALAEKVTGWRSVAGMSGPEASDKLSFRVACLALHVPCPHPSWRMYNFCMAKARAWSLICNWLLVCPKAEPLMQNL